MSARARNAVPAAARPALLAALLLLGLAALPRPAAAARIADLTRHAGDVPRRLVGYGLVTGLDGTGDRSFGGASAATPTVRSVVNLLRRFGVEVPAERLRLRNVAAVLVTAEVSPWLRAGGRFDVQVSALGDATSLRGGVLWMAPLAEDPQQPPVATAQGALLVSLDPETRGWAGSRANAGRVPGGGVLEVGDAGPAPEPRLVLLEPDLATARAIAEAIAAALGAGTARVEDPGAVALMPPAGGDGGLFGFLAAVDTLRVERRAPARIVIDARDGTVVAGGGLAVGTAAVTRRGLTVEVGAGAAPDAGDGRVRLGPRATVLDVAAGLHAAGASGGDVAAVFEALRAVGALDAEVVVR